MVATMDIDIDTNYEMKDVSDPLHVAIEATRNLATELVCQQTTNPDVL
jgi:hypothetical protein